MIINDVYITNLDILYALSKETKDNYYKLTYKLSNILESVILTLDLSDITSIEAIYLKKLSSNSKFYINELNIDNILDKLDDTELSSSLTLTKNILDNIESNEELGFDSLLYPSIVDKYDVKLYFKGSDILQLFGFDFYRIFLNEDNKIIDIYDGNEKNSEIISNNIIKIFYEYFYVYLDNKLTEVDLVADSYMYNSYYSKLNKSDDIVLANLVGPYDINVNFLNNDKENVKKGLSILKTNKDLIDDSVYAQFIVKSSYYTFLRLFLNNDFINDFEDMRIVLTSNDFYVPDDERLNRYEVRLNNALSSSIVLRDYYASNITGIKKYLYILNNTKIRYIINIKISDLYKLNYNNSLDRVLDPRLDNKSNIELKQILNQLEKYKMIITKIS